jgi:small-conductance mechanosensitive channel
VNLLHTLKYPVAIIGTIVAVLLAWLIHYIGPKYIEASIRDAKEVYRKLSFLTTTIVILVLIAIIVLWARPMQHTATFLGLIGAGVAVALRDPLLCVAGRIAIFAGNMYSVGDRIEINKMTGDIIDVGFFYTRMMGGG